LSQFYKNVDVFIVTLPPMVSSD